MYVEGGGGCALARMCVYVCACVRARVCVYVCVVIFIYVCPHLCDNKYLEKGGGGGG